MYVSALCEVQKREVVSLGLELLTIVRCYEVVGNQIWVCWKRRWCS